MQIKYSYIYTDTYMTNNYNLTTYKTKKYSNNIIQNKQLTHYDNKKQTKVTIQQKINKINAVSYSAVQGHPHTDKIV